MNASIHWARVWLWGCTVALWIAASAGCRKTTPDHGSVQAGFQPSEAKVGTVAGQALVSAPVCVSIQRGLSGIVEDALLNSGTGSDGSINKNYGSSCSLSTSSDSLGGQRQALLRFDLSSIPPGATITSAAATLNVLLGGGAPARAHRITAPWSESIVTWASFAGAFSPTVEGA